MYEDPSSVDIDAAREQTSRSLMFRASRKSVFDEMNDAMVGRKSSDIFLATSQANGSYNCILELNDTIRIRPGPLKRESTVWHSRYEY